MRAVVGQHLHFAMVRSGGKCVMSDSSVTSQRSHHQWLLVVSHLDLDLNLVSWPHCWNTGVWHSVWNSCKPLPWTAFEWQRERWEQLWTWKLFIAEMYFKAFGLTSANLWSGKWELYPMEVREEEEKGGLINRGRGGWLRKGQWEPETCLLHQAQVEGDAEGAQENTGDCESASIPPHALLCFLLEYCLLFWGDWGGHWHLGWELSHSAWAVPAIKPWSTNVCYREVLLSGQVVAVGKSLDLFLLTLSVAMLSCSPQSPWESGSRGSWVQAALGRTQHQRCFPRVILPRNQGNFMSLSSPQCCNSVFMTHQFFLHFCHCFPSGWPSSFPVPSNASCSAGPLQRWWRCSPAVLGCFP